MIIIVNRNTNLGYNLLVNKKIKMITPKKIYKKNI